MTLGVLARRYGARRSQNVLEERTVNKHLYCYRISQAIGTVASVVPILTVAVGRVSNVKLHRSTTVRILSSSSSSWTFSLGRLLAHSCGASSSTTPSLPVSHKRKTVSPAPVSLPFTEKSAVLDTIQTDLPHSQSVRPNALVSVSVSLERFGCTETSPTFRQHYLWTARI